MNKKITLSIIGLGAMVVVTAVSNTASNVLGFNPLPALAGSTDVIDSVSFYENQSLAEIYGTGDGRYSDYKADQEISLSGAKWRVSAAAYGRDNPVHLAGEDGSYKTLFFSSVFDANIANSYSMYSGTLSQGGVFDQNGFLNDYISISSNSSWTYQMAIFSTTTFSNVKDIGFFYRYAVGNGGVPSMGVIPLMKQVGQTNWTTIYNGAVGYVDGLVYYENGSTATTARYQVDNIDGSEFGRYYDGCYYYNDQTFNNLLNKEFYLGFLVYGCGAPYLMDIQLDGIIVNRHETAMGYMNGLNNKTICEDGYISDENTKKCFELLDRSFGYSLPGASDLDELKNYSIDSSFNNLKEANYYDQYLFLKSKIA